MSLDIMDDCSRIQQLSEILNLPNLDVVHRLKSMNPFKTEITEQIDYLLNCTPLSESVSSSTSSQSSNSSSSSTIVSTVSTTSIDTNSSISLSSKKNVRTSGQRTPSGNTPLPKVQKVQEEETKPKSNNKSTSRLSELLKNHGNHNQDQPSTTSFYQQNERTRKLFNKLVERSRNVHICIMPDVTDHQTAYHSTIQQRYPIGSLVDLRECYRFSTNVIEEEPIQLIEKSLYMMCAYPSDEAVREDPSIATYSMMDKYSCLQDIHIQEFLPENWLILDSLCFKEKLAGRPAHSTFLEQQFRTNVVDKSIGKVRRKILTTLLDKTMSDCLGPFYCDLSFCFPAEHTQLSMWPNDPLYNATVGQEWTKEDLKTFHSIDHMYCLHYYRFAPNFQDDNGLLPWYCGNVLMHPTKNVNLISPYECEVCTPLFPDHHVPFTIPTRAITTSTDVGAWDNRTVKLRLEFYIPIDYPLDKFQKWTVNFVEYHTKLDRISQRIHENDTNKIFQLFASNGNNTYPRNPEFENWNKQLSDIRKNEEEECELESIREEEDSDSDDEEEKKAKPKKKRNNVEHLEQLLFRSRKREKNPISQELLPLMNSESLTKCSNENVFYTNLINTNWKDCDVSTISRICGLRDGCTLTSYQIKFLNWMIWQEQQKSVMHQLGSIEGLNTINPRDDMLLSNDKIASTKKSGVLGISVNNFGKLHIVLGKIVKNVKKDEYQKQTAFTTTNEFARSVCGGVLSLQMRLGKSILTAALLSLEKQALKKGSKEAKKVFPNAQFKPTMIIAPPVVIQQTWGPRLEEWTPQLRVLNLGLPKMRSIDKDSSVVDIQQEYDVILVPTTILRALTNVLMVSYGRVIIDEAHDFADENTKQFSALKQLHYKRCWLLTGTPFGGGTVRCGNMGPLLNQMFGYHFMSNAAWKSLDNVAGLDRNRARFLHMATVLFASATSDLQEIKVETANRDPSVKLHFIDTSQYKSFNAQYQLTINAAPKLKILLDTDNKNRHRNDAAYARRIGNLCSSYIDVVSFLREQHVRSNLEFQEFSLDDIDTVQKDLLVQGNNMNPTSINVNDLDDRGLSSLVVHLFGDGRQGEHVLDPRILENFNDPEIRKKAEENICPICFDPFTQDDIYLFQCQHALCGGCVLGLFKGVRRDEVRGCVLCRKPSVVLQVRKVEFPIPPIEEEKSTEIEEEGKEDVMTSMRQHPKMIYLLNLLKEKVGSNSCNNNNSNSIKNKILIFTEYNSTIGTMYAMLCQDEDWKDRVLAIRSSCTASGRKKIFEEFNDKESGFDVLLAPMRTLSVGVDLSAANTIIFVEPTSDKAKEEQAIARIYQIKLDRPMSIEYLIMTDTIEETIIREYPSNLQLPLLRQWLVERYGVPADKLLVTDRKRYDRFLEQISKVKRMPKTSEMAQQMAKNHKQWALYVELGARLSRFYF